MDEKGRLVEAACSALGPSGWNGELPEKFYSEVLSILLKDIDSLGLEKAVFRAVTIAMGVLYSQVDEDMLFQIHKEGFVADLTDEAGTQYHSWTTVLYGFTAEQMNG